MPIHGRNLEKPKGGSFELKTWISLAKFNRDPLHICVLCVEYAYVTACCFLRPYDDHVEMFLQHS